MHTAQGLAARAHETNRGEQTIGIEIGIAIEIETPWALCHEILAFSTTMIETHGRVPAQRFSRLTNRSRFR